MPPPIPNDLPPPPPIEHVYTFDKYGRPVEVQEIIPIAPRSAEQFQYDFQPDLLVELIQAMDIKDIRKIVQIIQELPISFRKQTKKLFAEVGEMKKQNYQLHLKNEALQQQVDFLYHELNIQKRGFDDLCNFCN